MTTGIKIIDGETSVPAKVTPSGQLVVSPIDYSVPSSETLSSTGTAFNIIEPMHGKNIIITDIVVSADKNVSSTTPADIVLYEAESFDTITVFKTILAPQLVRSSNIVLTGLNMFVPAGLWVNAKTDDATVLITVMFYRTKVNGDIK